MRTLILRNYMTFYKFIKYIIVILNILVSLASPNMILIKIIYIKPTIILDN